ncbi:extracellular solute-binding protein [Nonomuraea ferruginea]
MAFVSGQYAQALNEQGLLEPIHAELIPNLANLYPEATQLSYDKGNKFSVPYTWGTTGICYRSDLVKQEPTSWNDILKPPGLGREEGHHDDHRALAGPARDQGPRLLGQHRQGRRDRQGQGAAP